VTTTAASATGIATATEPGDDRSRSLL
jgi:hypothetical protein